MGYSLIGFGAGIIPTVMLTYGIIVLFQNDNIVIDSYLPIAPELLLLINGMKQIFAFGFAYGVTPWINGSGYQNSFGAMAGINALIMLLGLPMWYWGKQIRHKSASWKLICW